MPQQTKTEALEEIARLIRRDIMNGTARLNETWWFDDDTKMQDRIAHVLLDYSDEEKPEELDKVCYNSRLDVFCGQIDELTEKCAALVVENKRLREDDDEPPAMVDLTEMARVLDECCVQKPGRYDNSTLRIDTDMSDPQPGKLLVVRLDASDVKDMKNPQEKCITVHEEDFVGFLVETPAVEVKEAVVKRTPRVGDKVRRIDDGGDGAIGIVEYIGAVAAGVRFIRPGLIEHLPPSAIEVIE